MTTANLLFEKKHVLLASISVDVSLSEQHSSEVEITEHPVETGTNIIDHARPKPDTLTIEGVITNDRMPDPTDPLVTQSFNDKTYQTRSQTSEARAGQAYRDLLELKDNAQLITVVTSVRNYENMMLRSLSVPRDPKVGQSLRFSATLVEVRVVSTKTVVLAAKPKTDLGKKATPVAPAALKVGLLKEGFNAVGLTKLGSGVAP